MFNFFKKLKQRAQEMVRKPQDEEVLHVEQTEEILEQQKVEVQESFAEEALPEENLEFENVEPEHEIPEEQIKEALESVAEFVTKEIFVETAPVFEPEKQQEEALPSAEDDFEPSFKLSFDVFKEAISKTTEAISGGISALALTGEKIDEDMLDELEEILIKADVGVDLSAEITDKIRAQKDKITTENLNKIIKDEFKKILAQAGSNAMNYRDGLNIFLITGVNGAGKTTLIGKLAHRFRKYGAKVLIAAGDTFRAAAEEQLDIWSKRAGADIVRRDGADSASVVFDAVKKAKNEGYDVLLIDTAGRLQNKFNLMEELKKIKKVLDNEAQGEIAESILVIDANTGQNGLSQAEIFQEAVQITAVGLTKLDGSAKGGIIAGIAKKLSLPVKLIGVGEKMEDLKDFDADDFVEALFENR